MAPVSLTKQIQPNLGAKMKLSILTKTMIATSLLLALSACKDLSGSLVTNEKISLRAARADVDIQPGTYRGALKVQSKKKINLELELPQGKVVAAFKTKQNLKDLKPGDKIEISAKDSGQPYDVAGVYDVDHSSSSPVRTTESCTYYTTEYRCHEVQDREQCDTVTECGTNAQGEQICKERTRCSGGGGSHTECGNESVAHSGTHEVEYYHSTRTEFVALKILASDKRVVAEFKGSDSDSDKHYTYQGSCDRF